MRTSREALFFSAGIVSARTGEITIRHEQHGQIGGELLEVVPDQLALQGNGRSVVRIVSLAAMGYFRPGVSSIASMALKNLLGLYCGAAALHPAP